MKMFTVPYYQMNHLLFNSYFPSCYNVWEHSDYNITYDNYLKSQINSDLISRIYLRDSKVYFMALKYLEGDTNISSKYVNLSVEYYFKDVALCYLNCLEKVLSRNESANLDYRTDFKFNISLAPLTEKLYLEYYNLEDFISAVKTEESEIFDISVIKLLKSLYDYNYTTECYYKALLLLYMAERGEIKCIK